MAVHCAHCNSTDTQALAQSFQCHVCGGQTSYAGDALEGGRNTNVTATTNTAAAIETTGPATADEPEPEPEPKAKSKRRKKS